MIHSASTLSPDQRVAVEALLGRAVAENEQISVRALPVTPQVSPERRAEIIAEMDAYFARIDAKRSNLSDEEADELINEALRSTRPNYRPIR